MKKWFLIIIGAALLVSALFVPAKAAVRHIGYALRTDQFDWEKFGETATAYTTPAVTERDYTNFTANHPNAPILRVSAEYNGLLFRFVVDDDADDTVFDVFASRGEDYLTRIATFTLIGGTQVGPATSTDAATVFCDTLTITNEQWGTTMKVIDGLGGDRIASVMFDAMGYDTFAFVGTTVDDTTLIQISGY